MSEQSTANSPPIDQSTYWNEEGGRRWTANIDYVEDMLAPLSERLLTGAAPKKGESVLDVGCGGGTTTAAIGTLVGSEGRVQGVDVSKVILEVARRRYHQANLSFVEADAATHRFDKGAFDLIASRFGVMFFDAPSEAFRNLRYGLKDHGRVVFLCWRAMPENPWMAEPAEVAFKTLPAPPPPEPGSPGPFAFADPDRLNDVLREAGFNDIQIDALDQPFRVVDAQAHVQFLCQMGPAATALSEANDEDRNTVVADLEALMEAHRVGEYIEFATATWLVQAW